jgi:hypothetical protein
LSDSPPIREIRRSSETADRAEGARRAVEWEPAEQRDQKELRYSRQSRRSSESGWVTALRADQRSALEVRPTEVHKTLKLSQGAASAKLFPVIVICRGCNQWANKSKYQSESTYIMHVTSPSPGTWQHLKSGHFPSFPVYLQLLQGDSSTPALMQSFFHVLMYFVTHFSDNNGYSLIWYRWPQLNRMLHKII